MFPSAINHSADFFETLRFIKQGNVIYFKMSSQTTEAEHEEGQVPETKKRSRSVDAEDNSDGVERHRSQPSPARSHERQRSERSERHSSERHRSERSQHHRHRHRHRRSEGHRSEGHQSEGHQSERYRSERSSRPVATRRDHYGRRKEAFCYVCSVILDSQDRLCLVEPCKHRMCEACVLKCQTVGNRCCAEQNCRRLITGIKFPYAPPPPLSSVTTAQQMHVNPAFYRQ